MLQKMRKYQFLFEELVKRDFKKKYKRTVLGMFWSVLSPLLMLLVMSLVFTQFFGRSTPHYTIYLFSGQLVFSYFTDATNSGMSSLMDNSTIFSKINVPKYMFLLSKNVSSFINFCLTLVVFLLFVAIDGIPFRWTFLCSTQSDAWLCSISAWDLSYLRCIWFSKMSNISIRWLHRSLCIFLQSSIT